MRLEIDPGTCTGHGRCYSVAPSMFDADDDGFGLVLDSEVDDRRLPLAQQAVDSCPERAIRLGS